jgi:hypothetical protein
MQGYYDLRESGSTSDFPNILGNLMYRSLIDWAKSGVPDVWRQWTAQGDLTDFRPANRVIGYEAEDLLPIGEEGVYQDSKLADAAYTIQLGTFGRQFSIDRHVIINDDLNYIKQQPKRFGRAAARSIAKFAAQTLLEGNPNTFDGNALFSSAHGNNNTGGGSVLSSANLQTGITFLRNQTVLGVYHTMTPRWLLVPPALEFAAKQILNSSIIVAAGTAGTVTQIGNANVLAGALGLIVDPFLTVATQYYVLADPSEAPVVDLAFLNGKQTPDLLIEKPTYSNLAGGDDPYELEFDVMHYKVRYDYGGAASLWWGGTRFVGA